MINFFRKYIKTNIIIFLFTTAVGLFSYWTFVRAQEQDPRIAKGVQVSPVRFDWDMNDGDERTGFINLKNYSNESYNVEVQVEDFYVTDDTTEARFFVPDPSHPLYAYDVINWIEKPDKLTLAPGEGRDISFHVKVPEGTPTGGYYGAIFFKTSPLGAENPADSQNSRIIVHQRVGVLLVMAVKGHQPIIRSAVLQKFKSLHKIFWDKPAKLITEILNNGNLHFKMVGNVDIYKFGKKMDSLAMDQRVVYPGKFRQYENEWNFSAWAYGYYKAKLDMVSEDGGIKVSGETTFWVIPWKTTLAIIILLVIIYLLYRIFTKKFEIRVKDKEIKSE